MKYILIKGMVFYCLLLSCTRMLDVGTPTTSTNAVIVYNTDAIAISAITGIYATLSGVPFTGQPHIGNLSFYASLSGDDLTLFSGSNNSAIFNGYYTNNLSAAITGGESWANIYNLVFNANAAIASLTASVSLTPALKEQLLGEALFVRAFCYFYLVNLYGDVPLLLTTDYKTNSTSPRTAKTLVWQQIIQDLQEAQTKLKADYMNAGLNGTTTERVRPNKWAATALLARAYLYTEKWTDAETQASAVIANTSLFDTASLANAFLKNSREAIWQLQPTVNGENTPDARTFVLPATGPTNGSTYPVYLNTALVNDFESGDKRRTAWVSAVTVGGGTYYYAAKYKLNTTTATSASEYIMVLRIAEQYLIRAEARMHTQKLTGPNSAVADLNYIRARAGLPGTTATTAPELMTAIQHERRVELYTEWGHRWLDMKRTGTIDAIMKEATPLKGGIWEPDWAYYPISTQELLLNRNLKQTQGYN